jgi:peptidoglycan hydrolase-like protein with peptidoglycan-binding domain
VTRLLFGRGCRGEIIRSVQDRLAAAGYPPGVIDGIYGANTERSVCAFQRTAGLPVTGNLDDVTWCALTNSAIPDLFGRALQLTAAFEGHGYGTVRGNWDGAWLTWGIVGFTLKQGVLTDVLLASDRQDPNLIRIAFGDRAEALREVLQAGHAEQEQWANSITDGVNVQEPWRSGFERLGREPIVQSLQMERAKSAYFVPATRTAVLFNLTTEQGVALAFDIHVQNGGIAPAVRTAILSAPVADERTRRIIVANAVADSSKPERRDDVRGRKLVIATGEGRIHQEHFVTANWGLDEYLGVNLG